MEKIKYRLKHFIKKNYLLIIIFTIVFFSFTWKLPFSVYTPGGLINVSDNLTKKDNSGGSINLTYVKSIEGTIPTFILSKIIPSWDIIKDEDIKYDSETIRDAMNRDIIMLYESISNAIYVAYENANKDPQIESQSVYITYIDKIAKSDLMVGDRILEIDNKEYSSSIDMITYIGTKEIGSDVELLVINGGKKYTRHAEIVEVEGEPKIGIVLSTINNYKNAISYDYGRNEQGPSGGLMISLAIYNNLIKDDITKGLTISGTGTIDILGNVGEIGGVKYKLAGAVKHGADVFIAPTGDNYKEAKKLIKKNKYKIKLIEGINFKQVLEEINKLEAK